MNRIMKSLCAVALVAAFFGGMIASSQAGEKRTIAYSIPSMYTTFFAACYHGIQQQAEEYGWDTVLLDPNNDINLQLTQLFNQATRGIDAVCVTPLDSESTAPAFSQLSKSGVPVFCIDRRGAGPVVCTLETDNVQVGREIGAKVAEDFAGKNAKILIVQGILTESTILDRTEGMKETLSKHSNITIIAEPSAGAYTNEASMSTTKNYLETNPDLDAIMCSTDALVPGILAALREAGRLVPVGQPGHVGVYSIDGAGETLGYIQAGTVDATFSQFPIQLGTDVVKAMKRHFDGEKVEERILLGGDVVSKDNFEALRPTLWGLIVK